MNSLITKLCGTRAIVSALCFVAVVGVSQSGSAETTNSCVECHRLANTLDAFPSGSQDQFLHWYGAVHGLNNVTCDKCHGGDPSKSKKQVAHIGVGNSSEKTSRVYFSNLPKTCGRCHRAVTKQFAKSEHHRRLTSDLLAPTCTTCHGFEMGIRAVKPLQLAGRCSLCHNSQVKATEAVVDDAHRLLEAFVTARDDLQQIKKIAELRKTPGKSTTETSRRATKIDKDLDALARHWHAFQLDQFETELRSVESAIEALRKQVIQGLR